VDIDGDAWVLRLRGPGDLRVIQQPATATATDPVPLGRPGLIAEITYSGTDPLRSQLIGTVRKGPNGDGKVYFAQLTGLGGPSTKYTDTNVGIKLIDMKGFWLGQTSISATADDPAISIPYGVSTFRFGGADTTFTPPGGTPLNQNRQSDTFTIDLGLPYTWGTSIIVEEVVTDAQAGQGTQPATQDSVVFNVTGRLNVFGADRIRGNADFPATGFEGGGGTIVRTVPEQERGIAGPMGYVRVGFDATNFTAQSSDRIGNFFVGGETSGVNVLAVLGVNQMLFGLGMDDVTVRAETVQTVQANRGMVSTEMFVTGNIGRMTLGGDVVNSTVLAGVDQSLATEFQTQTPGGEPQARSTSRINQVLIAGDVVDSIFAASVQPFDGRYDTRESLFVPHSFINAKVEGSIDNGNISPNKPDQAFYAKQVAVAFGPVNPPNVQEPPYPNPGAPPTGPRVLKPLQPTTPPRPRRIGNPSLVRRLTGR
jgi:hypothetical protein